MSNVSSLDPISLVQLVPLSEGAASFGMFNVSVTTSGQFDLRYQAGGYDPAVADIEDHSACASAACPSIPLSWNAPLLVASFSQPLLADAAASIGSDIVISVSTSTTTYSYASSTLGNSWSALGSTMAGIVQSDAVSPTEVAIVARSGTTWTVTGETWSGSSLGTTELVPTGAGSTGVLSAATAFVTYGDSARNVVVIGVAGSDQVQILNSSTAGSGYTNPSEIAEFENSTPTPALPSVGSTNLHPVGSSGGEVALTLVDSELFLAFTSVSGGGVFLDTQGSENGGSTWTPTYTNGPLDDTVTNLSLATSPAGLVYALWQEVAAGAGGLEEGIFFPDGHPMITPTSVTGDSGGFLPAFGKANIVVDSLQRPIAAWPTRDSLGYHIVETGAYLGPSGSEGLLNNVIRDPLVSGDFASPSDQAAFNTSVSSSMASISTSLSSGKLCNAQNATALDLYPEVTHVPLSAVSGSGTTCGPLNPASYSSPILNTSGIYTPNVYLAVYADWLLESEGVLVSPNGFGNNTTGWLAIVQPAGYVRLVSACTAAYLPNQPNFNLATVPIWECPGYAEGIYAMGTTGYSPTSFEVTPTIEMGYGVQYILNISGPVTIHTYVTSWLNVSVNSGPVHSIREVGSALPWLYVTNLTPNTLYSYSVTVDARITHLCTPSCSTPTVLEYAKNVTLHESFQGAVRTQLRMWDPQLEFASPQTSW